jgi:hypothetical protein
MNWVDKDLLIINNRLAGRSGGIGRRAGFKIPSWQQGEGSSPSFGSFRCLFWYEGGELAEFVDDFGHFFDGVVDLLFGVVS